MISLDEELDKKCKPALQYIAYLVIKTVGGISVVVFGTIGIPIFLFEHLRSFWPIPFVAIITTSLLWAVLIDQSIAYHITKTEMTWERGPWFIPFRFRIIAPYNRITGVDIVQGPLMRLFHISNLEIQTAGEPTIEGVSPWKLKMGRRQARRAGPLYKFTFVGIKDPEPLRDFIMDLVRGQPSVVAVTGAESAGISSYHTNSAMVALLEEEFKPSLQYRPYFAIRTIGYTIFMWPFLFFPSAILVISFAVWVVLFVVLLTFLLLWVVLYYPSIVYHFTKTEITLRRGIWFRRTSIVSYNRITNVDIVQGPLMRLFHISNLKIQTPGSYRDYYSSLYASPNITLVGIKDPKPLQAFIMDCVRNQPSVAAVIGAETAGTLSYHTR